MGHIYIQNEQVNEAMKAWVDVYNMAKSMNLAEALEALAGLAPQLGMAEGLDAWEKLSQSGEYNEELEFLTQRTKTEVSQKATKKKPMKQRGREADNVIELFPK